MLLFCAKTIVKEIRNFRTSPSEEEEEERKKNMHLGRLATFWFGTFTVLFSATIGMLLFMITLKDEW